MVFIDKPRHPQAPLKKGM